MINKAMGEDSNGEMIAKETISSSTILRNDNSPAKHPLHLNSSIETVQPQLTVDPTTGEVSPNGYGRWSSAEQGVTLTWRDLSVYATQLDTKLFRLTKTSYKRIINNVCGVVRPGSLVAIMGGSGAGKSTLMAALAYRDATGMVVDGDVRVNGRPIGPYMHRLSGFMHQEDLFVGSLTVTEHLTLMARLRFDRRTSSAERNRHISELMLQLGLTKSAHTRIGCMGEGKTLSGGEKKRLSFATEMLTNPPLLFCDEPTTGLDSFSAQKLLRMMKLMTLQGKTILCTIHQPSSELFDMFHQLVLVADGRIAFTGDATSALEFFAIHGYHCPATYNPADFFIRTLAIVPGSEKSSGLAVRKICDQFAVSEAAAEVDILVELQLHMADGYSDNDYTSKHNFKPPFWTTKLLWLTYRSVLQVVRDPSVQALRIVQKLMIAVMAGLCFLATDTNTQLGIQAVQGALFIFVSENTFSPMYSVLATFPRELPLFLRELRSGLYPTRLYYLSKMLAMFPGLVVEPLLFILVAYWMVGLRNSIYSFMMTAVVVTLTMNVSTACGCFFSNAFSSVTMAMAYLVPFDYVLMITSGLFIKLSTLPAYISWAQYFSWLMYSNEAMSILQWDGRQNITCETTNPDLPCLRNGAQILDKYSFSTSHLGRNIYAMLGLYCIFHFLGYVCLRLRTRK